VTFRQRIALDRWLAVPLAVAVNAAVRIAGVILRRDHTIRRETTRQIVVCKLVGMGSVIQASPLLRALKATFPEARLTFLTLKGNRALLTRLDGVDEVLCLDDSGAMRMLISTLLAVSKMIVARVDHYFDLEVYSGFSCLLSVFSLAHNRLGFYRHSIRFKKGIYTHLVYFNTRMPVRRLYLQLGRVAGVAANCDDRLGPIHVEPAERESVRQRLSALGADLQQPYILVNPNASDLLLERRWPEAHFAIALSELAKADKQVVLMGSRTEATFVHDLRNRVSESLRAKVFDTAGLLTLGEAFALIEGAACVLTNDTGPMHMAFALARPSVCLVGPADPVHYGLEMPWIVTLYARVPCSPCIYEVDEPPCHGNNVCMQRLPPELVVGKVLELLARCAKCEVMPAEATSGICRLPLIWDSDGGTPLGIVVRESVSSGHVIRDGTQDCD
jgi:ADP-heptose:LPS heptosyltransferase